MHSGALWVMNVESVFGGLYSLYSLYSQGAPSSQGNKRLLPKTNASVAVVLPNP